MKKSHYMDGLFRWLYGLIAPSSQSPYLRRDDEVERPRLAEKREPCEKEELADKSTSLS